MSLLLCQFEKISETSEVDVRRDIAEEDATSTASSQQSGSSCGILCFLFTF